MAPSRACNLILAQELQEMDFHSSFFNFMWQRFNELADIEVAANEQDICSEAKLEDEWDTFTKSIQWPMLCPHLYRPGTVANNLSLLANNERKKFYAGECCGEACW
eukprot:1268285-Rhodomonas_salina.1